MTEESTTPLLLTRVRAARDEITKTAALEPIFLSTPEKEALLREAVALEAQAVALRLRVMAVADDVADETGARDIGAWAADRLHSEFRTARADMRLAHGLETRWHGLRDALAGGRLSPEHARVIAKALDVLPGDLAPDELARAEQTLLDEATRLDPRQLRRVGAHLLDVLDPAGAEDALGKRLAAEEQRAGRRTYLTLTDLGDGTVHLRARLPRATGVRLKTYLDAFTQPRLADLTDNGTRVPYERLLGQAFGQLLERIDPDRLPHHGGDATTLIVTMSAEQLAKDLGTATIGADAQISAGEARRLACNASLIPAVLGTDSHVLDLGRTARLFTPAQRKALRIKYPTCAAEGCTVSNTCTEAHHLDAWGHGGKTDLARGVLLCPYHHRLAHHAGYDLTRLPNGAIRFHRRT